MVGRGRHEATEIYACEKGWATSNGPGVCWASSVVQGSESDADAEKGGGQAGVAEISEIRPYLVL